MKITLFNNKKGLIHGDDSKRIGCEKNGILKIGMTEIAITSKADSIMPLLFNGCTGRYDAVFTDHEGTVYHLERLEIRGGRIMPPSDVAMELMSLRCKMDSMEKEIEALRAENAELKNIFDTNSLNFLIK